jgi:hypothetical protein
MLCEDKHQERIRSASSTWFGLVASNSIMPAFMLYQNFTSLIGLKRCNFPEVVCAS